LPAIAVCQSIDVAQADGNHGKRSDSDPPPPVTRTFLNFDFIPSGFVSDCVRLPGRYICSGFSAQGDTDGIQARD
jgi:hypothetical protein